MTSGPESSRLDGGFCPPVWVVLFFPVSTLAVGIVELFCLNVYPGVLPAPVMTAPVEDEAVPTPALAVVVEPPVEGATVVLLTAEGVTGLVAGAFSGSLYAKGLKPYSCSSFSATSWSHLPTSVPTFCMAPSTLGPNMSPNALPIFSPNSSGVVALPALRNDVMIELPKFTIWPCKLFAYSSIFAIACISGIPTRRMEAVDKS